MSEGFKTLRKLLWTLLLKGGRNGIIATTADLLPVSSGRRNSWMEGGCDGGSAAFGSGPAGSAEVAGAAGGSAA